MTIAAALELVNVLVTGLTIFFSINVETGSTSSCRGTAPPCAGFYSSDFNRPIVIAVSTVDVVAGVGRAMLQGHVAARCSSTRERNAGVRGHVGSATVTPPLATIILAIIKFE